MELTTQLGIIIAILIIYIFVSLVRQSGQCYRWAKVIHKKPAGQNDMYPFVTVEYDIKGNTLEIRVSKKVYDSVNVGDAITIKY